MELHRVLVEETIRRRSSGGGIVGREKNRRRIIGFPVGPNFDRWVLKLVFGACEHDDSHISYGSLFRALAKSQDAARLANNGVRLEFLAVDLADHGFIRSRHLLRYERPFESEFRHRLSGSFFGLRDVFLRFHIGRFLQDAEGLEKRVDLIGIQYRFVASTNSHLEDSVLVHQKHAAAANVVLTHAIFTCLSFADRGFFRLPDVKALLPLALKHDLVKVIDLEAAQCASGEGGAVHVEKRVVSTRAVVHQDLGTDSSGREFTTGIAVAFPILGKEKLVRFVFGVNVLPTLGRRRRLLWFIPRNQSRQDAENEDDGKVPFHTAPVVLKLL